VDCVTGGLGRWRERAWEGAHFNVTAVFTWTCPPCCGTISPWPGVLPGKDGVLMQGMQRKSWAWMLVCVLLMAGVQAHAQRTEGDRAAASGPYEAEVAVRSQGDSERNAGFGRALAVVLAKVTGDRGAAQRPGVRDELGNAKDYVSGYDYRQDEGVSATGAPSFQTTLVARFKQDDVDQLIQMLGLPSWPLPRPKPVLWLAIDDGRSKSSVRSGCK